MEKPDEDTAAWMDRCHELELEVARLRKEKPKVSREWVDETIKGLFEYGLDAGWMRGHLTMRLKEIGVEVEE